MIDSNLEAVEALRVMRAEGNLTVARTESAGVKISCDRGPELRREGGSAEIFLRGTAILGVPNSVALEILECTGNLVIEGFAGNLAIGRVGGNLRVAGAASVAIRGEVRGNLEADGAATIEGDKVNGNLSLGQLRTARFISVGGNVEAAEITEHLAINAIGGRLHLEDCAATTRIGRIGDKLELETVGAVEVETVGGKVRAENLSGDLRIGRVGGKVSVEQTRAGVHIAIVGGQVSLRAIEGDVDLPAVGGAVSIRGNYRPATRWTIRSGGRLTAEVPADASVEFEAASKFGRVRVHGLEAALKWLGRDRLSGKLGEGQCRLMLETTGADIIIESPAESSREERYRFSRRRFGAPFESLADDLRTEIPGLVNEIVDAAGKLASTTLSSGFVRDIARSVTDGLREVERGLADMEKTVPEKMSEQASRLGRRIRELIAEMAEDSRAHHHGPEFHWDKHRDTWQRWRNQWQAYQAERTRTAPGEKPAPEVKPAPQAEPRAEPAPPPNDEQVFKILQAVREGKIRPEEADELIKAWEEVNRPH